MEQKDRVVVEKNSDIDKAVISVLEKLDLPSLDGKRILLKPNVGREVNPREAINTNPDVVKSVFNYLNSKYDAKFFLGDSPIILTDTKKAFIQSGFQELMEHDEIEWLDLDAAKPKLKEIPDGQIIKSIKVIGLIDDFDYIISIPVLKLHMHTGATLGFKNMKGLLYKREKIKLHHLMTNEITEKARTEIPRIKNLDLAIADLYHIINPDLVIIDATFAMEGMGPSAGSKVQMDTIIGSKCAIAADVVALKLTMKDWTLNKVPHLKLIAQKEVEEGRRATPLTLSNLKELLEIIPEDFEKFSHPLEEPPASVSMKYPNVHVITKNTCSACISTLSLFLKNNQEFINKYFTPDYPLKIAMGLGIEDSDVEDTTYLVGNCTIKHRNKGIFLKGCAPVQSKLLELVKETLDEDTKKVRKIRNE